jgi:acetyltransferase-like isoleucine patch superfamily enzyme
MKTENKSASPVPRIRGRQLFKFVKPLLLFCSFFLKIFPNPTIRFLLKTFRFTHGLKGIAVRYCLVRSIAQACGDNVAVHESVYLFSVEKISLGNHITIHPLSYLDAEGEISIGNNVSIAHNTSIISFEHDYHDPKIPITSTPLLLKKVIIEDDVWIGAGVRILGGVTIGTGSVIGAGAVVTKDIPPMSIAAGVPAHIIKSRKAEIPK